MAKNQQNNPLVYVITGDEQTLINAKYTELINKLVAADERDTGLLVIDPDKAIIGDILNELRTVPFFTKRRVVAIRNADKFISAGEQEDETQNKKSALTNREILEKYFENPSPTGILVLTVSSWPKTTRLAKKLPSIGELIEVKSPTGKDLINRIINYAQDSCNKSLKYNTAALLIELAGEDITRLYTEIDKLAVYTANEKEITISHIESLIGRNREFDAFEILDTSIQRKTGPAIERLRKMFAEDRSAEYSTIGAFAYHFRRLFNAKKLLQEGLNEYFVSKRVWLGYNKDAQFVLLRRLSLKQIGDQIKKLAEIDYAVKRGQAQPRIAIEQFVLELASL